MGLSFLVWPVCISVLHGVRNGVTPPRYPGMPTGGRNILIGAVKKKNCNNYLRPGVCRLPWNGGNWLRNDPAGSGSRCNFFENFVNSADFLCGYLELRGVIEILAANSSFGIVVSRSGCGSGRATPAYLPGKVLARCRVRDLIIGDIVGFGEEQGPEFTGTSTSARTDLMEMWNE